MTKQNYGKSRLSGHFHRLRRVQMLITGFLIPGLAMTSPVLANPSGGVVVHGDVAIGTGAGGNLQINQASNQAIIDWASFSIDAGELTQFIQPGSNAAVLNRVTGGDPTAIHGALQANGNVFVINPNGILIGAGGTIDVHGLALSTLDISNGEFLAGGDMVFNGAGEGVTNMGRINAVGGDVFLIGKTVTNSGSITASGTVGLAAGEEVLLKAAADAGGERIFVRAAGSGVSGTGILNDGTIEGAAVELKAHGNMYALAINNKGSIRATGSSNSGGRVFLNGAGGSASNSGSIKATAPRAGNSASVLIEAAYAKVDGSIKASGGDVRISATEDLALGGKVDVSSETGLGGSVIAEGREINMASGSEIDASGFSGGGNVRIGGGFQGNDAEVRNAENLDVAEGSVTIVDVTGDGDAGSAIFWADRNTLFKGEISGQALGAVGNGGFAEVSGKQNLTFEGSVDLGNGMLLLDPDDFVVDASNSGAIETSLNAGTNVVIYTNPADPGTGGTGAGHIRVIDDIETGTDAANNGSLTLLAAQDIYIVRDIRLNSTGGGDLNLVAGWDGTTGFDVGANPTSPATGVGAIDMDTLFFDTTGTYGQNNGSIVIGRDIAGGTAPDGVSVGSRAGSSNAVAYDFSLFGGNLTASTGADSRYAQFGYRASAPGMDPSGAIRVQALNDVVLTANQLTGSSEDNSFAMIGHGGVSSLAQQAMSGDITVEAGNNVDLNGGLDRWNFAQIGHGGRASNSSATEVSLNGKITVDAGNLLSLDAGPGTYSFTRIGLGGLDMRVNASSGGDIDVDAGTITATAGLGAGHLAEVQIGHGGYNAEYVTTGSTTADYSFGGWFGEIDVETTSGGITFKTGTARSNSAQIGHGGGSNTGNHGYDTVGATADALNSKVIVKSAGDITFDGSLSESANRQYGQIGHGGWDADGSHVGDIEVSAVGSITFTAGSVDDAYAMIGNGGNDATGDRAGDINVTAGGNISFIAGDGPDTAAQIGHGGRSSNGLMQGNISVTSTGGEVLVDSSSGGAQSYAQIGHGGYASKGDKGAAGEVIAVTAADDVRVLSGGDAHAYAQIGNGGYDADADSADDAGSIADITVEAGTDGFGSVMLAGSNVKGDAPDSHDNAYTQIGNGGYSATGDHGGDVTVTAADDITMQVGRDQLNYVMIGHGGEAASGLGGGVGHSGAITLVATSGSLNMNGSPVTTNPYHNGYRSSVMVGHGGRAANGNHTGDISVTVGDAVSMAGGLNDENMRQIGHGGYVTTGDLSGSISVTAENDITLSAGTNDYTYARVGHGGRLSNGDYTAAFINVTSNQGSVRVWGGNQNSNGGTTSDGKRAFAQIGLGGMEANGTMDAPITVTARGDIIVKGGGRHYNYAQIGNGGYDSDGDKSGEIHIESTAGRVSVLGADRQINAFAQIGHGGQLIDGDTGGDITIIGTTGVDIIAGENTAQIAGEEAFAQIGHGGLDVVGNKSGFLDVTTDGNLSILAGEANKAFALLGHGGVNSEGYIDGSISAVIGGDLTITGGSGAAAGEEGDFNFAMIGHSLAGAVGGFGGYAGVDGIVIGEGEYYTDTDNWIVLPEGTELLYAPQPSGQTDATYIFSNVRGGAYAQIPYGSPTGATTGSYIEYEFTVDQTGSYRLTPRWSGYNGNSDSMFYDIVELKDGTGNTVADWYEFTSRGSASFDWDTSGGGFEQNSAGDSNQPALWDLVAGTTYTLRATPRESGMGLDAWALQLDGSPTLTGMGPGATFANRSDVSGASDIDITVGGDILITSGAESDSYAAIGHGGSSFAGVGANVQYGTGADGADISVTTSGGRILLDGNAVAGSTADVARRYAVIGHHGVDAGFDAYGDIDVHAGGGSVTLNGGSANDSFAAIGHSGAGDFLDVSADRNGDICVVGANGVTLGSSGSGERSYTQIGHGGHDLTGDFSGAVTVVASSGDVTLDGGTGVAQYAQIGHGGSGANGALSGDIEVAAVAGDLTVTGSNDATNYAMFGHGAGDASSAGTRGGGVQLFAGDVLSAVNGTSDNAFVFHQTAGGLNVPGNYLGGNGFQLIGANGVTLPDSAMGGLSAMITGNIANGPVFVATSYDDGPVTIDAASLATLNDDVNRVIAVGGDITLLSSFQNAGSGDVMLLAGYNGDGTMGGAGSFNAANCEVTMNGSLVADFNNCAADGSRLTIGSSTQGTGLAVGSRTGATSLGADTITLTAGNNLDAFSQIGFFTDGSGAASGAIAIGVGSGGLTMTSGNADGAYTQIGHGGNNTSTDAVSADITISFCEPGDILMEGGDGLAAYTQIGHGGNENVRNGSNVDSDILITGFRNFTMSAGYAAQAYAQVGLGGFSGSGFDGGNIDLSGSGSLQITAGGIDAYGQIGHGGKDQVNGASEDDRINIQMGSFVSLEAGAADGGYAQIGHGGTNSTGESGSFTRSGDITVRAGGADGSGDAIILKAGSGAEAYAQIGLGGSNADSSYTGNIDIDAAGDIELIGGTGARAYSQIGHGGYGAFDATRTVDDAVLEQSGSISLDTTAGGSLNMQGANAKTSGAIDAYTQVGHGGSGSSGDADGMIGINLAGGISAKAGGDASGNDQPDRTYSQIGHGGYDADGRKSGDIEVTTVDAIQIYAGTGEFAYAQLGHGGTGESVGADSGDISITTTGASGALDLRGGHGGDGWNIHSYGQIGHGGRSAHGAKSGDITLSIAAGIGLINGNHDGNYKQIGHGGSGTNAALSGAINVTANGNIDLVGGVNDLTSAQIGHGGSDSEGNINADAIDVVNTSGVNVTSQTGRIMIRGGSYNGDNADGRRAYAQIGSGGFSYGVIGNTIDTSISVNAATGVLIDGGGRDFNYGMIGNGGSLSDGAKLGNIEVTSQNGDISVYASEHHELAFAQIGHGGFRADGTGGGSIHVKALNGSIALRNGGGIDAGTDGGDFYTTTPLNASYSYAQIGHGGAQAGDYDRDGEICVVAINGVSLSSSEEGDRAYTQIGHGGVETDGEFTGDINVVSTTGGVSVSAAGTGSEGQYAQIGHGGLYSDGRMSSNISVVAGSGDTVLQGGSADLSFAMIGNGDGSKTSTGTREGGVHLFSSGQLIGANGAGTESNVFIFHQNANGLLAADYEGGDGYQKVANGGINLAASATVDESTIINGNLGNGTITIVDSSQTDYTIDASNIGNGMVDTPEDFYIMTGGNITMKTSFQNSGAGDVTLLAGWNGTGTQLDGSVEYGDPINFCEPIIKAGGYEVDFTNCETFGNNGKVLTIGSVDQTSRVSGGSAGGTSTFAGAAIRVLGSNDVANAGTQLGFFADGTTDIGGAINVYAKDGGLLLDGGTNGSFAQIGHGGSGSISGALLDAPITITFCADSPAGAIEMLGGSDGAYAQIGHGGPSSGGAVSGNIDINGAGSLTMTSGDAYTQIGHGGDDAGLTSVTNSNIELDVRSFLDLNAGAGTFDYAQIGHVGRNPENTDVLSSNILINTGSDQAYGTGAITLTGGGSNAYAQIGHGGARNDNNSHFATYSGDIMIGKSSSITVEAGTGGDAYAQIGHGGEGGGSDGTSGETPGDLSGNISVATDGLLQITAGSSGDGYAQVGHGGEQSLGVKSGNLKIEAGSIRLSGPGGSDAYTQIGHGGESANGDISGAISILSLGDIDLFAAESNTGAAQIGHGSGAVNSSGSRSGELNIFTAGALSLTDSSKTSALISHQTSDGISAVDYGLLGEDDSSYSVVALGGINMASNSDQKTGAGDVISFAETLGAATGSGDVTIVSGGTSAFEIGSDGTAVNYTGSGDLTILSGGDLTITGSLNNLGTGNIGVLAGWANAGSTAITTPDFSGTGVPEFTPVSLIGTVDGAEFGLNGAALNIGNSNQSTGISLGSKSGTTTVIGDSVNLAGSSLSADGYSQIGFRGDATGSIVVQAGDGGVVLDGGGQSGSFSQIGHGGLGSAASAIDASITTTTTGAVALSGGIGEGAYAQIGNGGTGVNASKDGDVTVTGASLSMHSGGANSYTQIGSGGLMTRGDVESTIRVTTTVGGIALNGGGSDNAFSLIGSGGAFADGQLDGDIIVNSAAGVDVLGGGTAGDAFNGTRNFAQIGHSVQGFFVETIDGIFFVDALDYTTRHASWIEVPNEGASNPAGVYSNATDGDYLHLPNGAGGLAPLTGSAVTYELDITTAGTYRLLPRWVGYDGASDSVFFDVVELKDGAGGAIADYYEFVQGGTGNFNSVPFTTVGGAEQSDGSASGHTAAIFDFNTTGTYTVRITPREDGVAVDSFVLQLTSLPSAFGPEGPALTRDAPGVGGVTGDISVTAVDDINLVAGINSDSYATIGHGGTDRSIGNHASFGTAGDTADITVTSTGGSITLDGGQSAGDNAETIRRYAAIGHHGAEGQFDSYGNIQVDAAGGSILLNSGAIEDATARIGHGGDEITGTQSGNISTSALNDIILTGGAGIDTESQIGHSVDFGSLSGELTATTAGAITLNGGAGLGASSQIGHGGNLTNVDISGPVTVNAGGALSLNGGATNAYAQVGQGGNNSNGSKDGAININASEVALTGGSGLLASARIGNGGAVGTGNLTGAVSVTSTSGDITLQGGGTNSGAQIGNGGQNYAGDVVDQSVTVDSANDIILLGGGVRAATLIGNGGADFSATTLSGNVTATAFNSISLIGGGTDAFSQIGNGGTSVRAAISGTTSVTASGGSISLDGSSTTGAYAKIGHGDDLDSSIGRGDRSGDILVASATDITLTGGMIGQINSAVDPAQVTSLSGITQIGVSQLDPADENGGTLTADVESEFQGTDSLEFYLPQRENNQIAAGARLNGVAYEGARQDPTVDQLPEEFAVNVINPDGSTVAGNIGDNLIGASRDTAGTTPQNFGFFFDTIELVDAPPVEDDTTDGGDGDGGSSGFRFDAMNYLPSNDRLVDDERREAEQLYTGFNPYSMYYEGYEQYDSSGNIIFNVLFMDGLGSLNGGN
ncbi:MAG: filamentous hemagglutinin N-terminal domain-containing protein [Verrucomicrobiales bacterium]|nr:filamentous hemagglutinin N-terminal domain-containing protein [Verrucomicrobiales bacterium]